MGTRCGAIDYGVPLHRLQARMMTADECCRFGVHVDDVAKSAQGSLGSTMSVFVSVGVIPTDENPAISCAMRTLFHDDERRRNEAMSVSAAGCPCCRVGCSR